MKPAILLMLGALTFHASACAAALSPDDAAAKDVALQWLQLVDSGDYEHAVLQTPEQIGLQQNWMTYLLARRRPLGRVKNRQVVEIKHKPTVHGARTWWKYKVVRLKTSFEHPPSVRAGRAPTDGVASKPAAMEEVVLTKMACCWEVSGYSITAVTSDR